MPEPEDHPVFGEPLDSDEQDDLSAALLAELFKPRRISVALGFTIAAEYHSVEGLVKQYRSLNGVPGTQHTRDEIISEIRDSISVMDNFENIVSEAVATTIRGIIANHPILEVRNE